MSDFEFAKKDITIHPIVYAFADAHYPGYLKVGQTNRSAEKRKNEVNGTKKPTDTLSIEGTWSAMRPDGSIFSDHDVHYILKNEMHVQCMGGEYYKCTLEQLERAIYTVRNRLSTVTARIYDFKMRPEQVKAVEKTKNYYESVIKDNPHTTPKFLWNCKMRFGKTFATYELAKAMDFKRVLVLTFKPAVKSAWKEDLNTHVDFEGWQFLAQPSQKDLFSESLDIQYERADKTKPIVCFGSLQDLLGVGPDGKIKAHNEWIHTTNWDLVVFDEYHFGAWREKAKDLFEKEDEEQQIEIEEKKIEDSKGRILAYDKDSEIDESFLPITTNHYLFLSGTPFRALNNGEFIEEQIYSWTYSDEQNAKTNWDNSKGPNPYESLPRMVMLTYKLPESIRKIAMQGEFNEFDLNTFFSTKGDKNKAEFVYKKYVQSWLDLIRGSYMETAIDDLKTGNTAPFPYSDIKLRQALQHTLWFLPSVNACYAMKNLLNEKQNRFYHDYKIVICAGSEAGQGADALNVVEQAMENPDPISTQTITLSCGKLTTGVTVRPWTGVFMLRNLKQPETYFQTAFRAQSPWTYKENGKTEIIKRECYVFDFAPNRTLRQLSEYACRLNVRERNPETKVAEFIKFLPVLSYEANMMREISASEILDIAMSGTSATLLARRWESALLVNVDNDTLSRLLANDAAMEALMSIEDFRKLNFNSAYIETIINKSKEVKDAKKRGIDKNGTDKQKKVLSDEEKEYKSKRKEIQEKLIKFATRIPVFMYLTDFREVCLRDVITQLEPQLFKKVTGLEVKDFELLSSIGLFNEALMNDSIYKFRRYEESSLEYAGINKHKNKDVGGFSTVLSKEEYRELYGASIPKIKVGDKVQVERSGICTVSSVQQESFSVKNNRGKALRFNYPIAFELGTVKLIEE